jgi:hypothetical protein
MTWEEKLKANLNMFDGTKKIWLPEELALAYEIWNGANGEKHGYRQDTGCSDCRRAIVKGVAKLAEQLKD